MSARGKVTRSFYAPADLDDDELLVTALTLIGEQPPPSLPSWPELDRLAVYDWAVREHMRASDNPVRRRPRPAVMGPDPRHVVEFDAPPVVGQPASGVSRGPSGSRRGATYETRWSGVYEGVRPSEWTGLPAHCFHDGEIGGVPQGRFAFPVSQVRPDPARRRR